MSQALPFVSVIVPTYDRPRQLARCLRSLSSLDYPSDRFEVIVVDDGSESPPEDIVADAPGQLDTTLLSPPHAGPASARNYGAAHARGEYLAFTDDDCVPTPSWLRAIAVRFAATPGDAIGGRTLNGLPKNLYATASQALTDYLYVYNGAPPMPRRLSSLQTTWLCRAVASARSAASTPAFHSPPARTASCAIGGASMAMASHTHLRPWSTTLTT